MRIGIVITDHNQFCQCKCFDDLMCHPQVLTTRRRAGFDSFVGMEFEPTVASKEAALAVLKLIKG